MEEEEEQGLFKADAADRPHASDANSDSDQELPVVSLHTMDSLITSDLDEVRRELERVEGDSDWEKTSSVEEDAPSLEWAEFDEYFEDQGVDYADYAEYNEVLHEGYGSNGEADAAEYDSQEEYDTAIGAEGGSPLSLYATVLSSRVALSSVSRHRAGVRATVPAVEEGSAGRPSWPID